MKKISTLFAKRKFLDKLFNNSILSSENGWSCAKNFTDLLEIELKRTYRTNSPLSLVVIDLTNLKENTVDIHSVEFASFTKMFLTLIISNSREIDIKCADRKGIIKILLPDTTLEGSKIFTDKIIDCLHREMELNNYKKYIPILTNIKFATHPLNHISGKGSLKAKSNILYHQQTEYVSNEEPEMSSVKSIYRMNWDLEPIINETLVLPIPSFLQGLYTEISAINYRHLKRVLDVLGSIVGITLFLPATIIISILIKLTSDGPVLFKQKRLGHLGKEFTFLKFRTMSINSDDKIHREYVEKLIQGKDEETNFGTNDKPLYKIENDPRITWIGHYLRKFSLDELPQFFNVLRGEMSLVGPRPPIPYEFENYQFWHYRRVFEVKPGITGLWQVNGRSKTTFNDMVRLDNQYINNQSFLLDTKIMLKTLAAVFNTDGAL